MPPAGLMKSRTFLESSNSFPMVARIISLPRSGLEPTAERVCEAERWSGDGGCGAAIAPGLAGRTAFTLRVQTGCDQTCAYCIIPSTRGAGRSRPLRDVLSEIDRVSDAGYREVAITGVHLGSYGRDLADGSSLAVLLRTIERRCSGMRFRISSLEPMDCSDEIVDLVAASKTLAPHFHLPLQHASDGILVAMRRPYTIAYYRRLVDRIRERIPHASIGTDIIVGFPGETDRDFETLEAYLRDSPVTHVHVFPYSDRPGTAASERPEKVHGSIVRDRASAVRRIGRELNRAFHEAQHDSVRPGLTIEDGSLVVTDNYLKVRIPPGRARNEWVTVGIAYAGDAPDWHGRLTNRNVELEPEPIAGQLLSALPIFECLRQSADRRPHGCPVRDSCAPTPSGRRLQEFGRTCSPVHPTGA